MSGADADAFSDRCGAYADDKDDEKPAPVPELGPRPLA